MPLLKVERLTQHFFKVSVQLFHEKAVKSFKGKSFDTVTTLIITLNDFP
jgi:hypothetical protein